jgi:ABC-2 type transport system ATP-binding protein
VLSKGQYAKVGLALAMAIDPEVLILDEPTSGLDLIVRREFLSSMVRLSGRGRTILICSHQVAEIERIASHVAFLHAGKALLVCPVEQLRERIVRVRVRCAVAPSSMGQLGTVLQEQHVGNRWQLIVREPDRGELQRLRTGPGVADYEELPLNLEEIYCALFAREVVPA